jgi:regulator of replication initiation timing
MTENLLQKLEEKMMVLLTELEDLRREIQRLNHENSFIRIERETHAKKLADLISLLDTISSADNVMANVAVPSMKPVLVQG